MDHPLIQLQDMGRSPSNEMLLTLGFAGKTSFNNAILGNTSTQNFFYTIMGSELDRWQFVQNVFSDRDDVQLTIFDKYADTPFKCLLIALLIRQMREVLSLRYKSIQVLMNNLPAERPGLIGMAGDRFDTTRHRNEFVQQAIARIVGQIFSFSCRRNHLRKSDILLTTEDFTLKIRAFPSLTKSWIMGNGASSYLSAGKLLDEWQTDFPCYNQSGNEYDKNGVYISADLIPNKK